MRAGLRAGCGFGCGKPVNRREDLRCMHVPGAYLPGVCSSVYRYPVQNILPGTAARESRAAGISRFGWGSPVHADGCWCVRYVGINRNQSEPTAGCIFCRVRILL